MSRSSESSTFPLSAAPFRSPDHVAIARWKAAGKRQGLVHWLTSGSRAQTIAPTRPAEPDPYLLVMLADQEKEANRQEEAQCLIEAAYAAFDQRTMGSRSGSVAATNPLILLEGGRTKL
jgi:hypothetical protein